LRPSPKSYSQELNKLANKKRISEMTELGVTRASETSRYLTAARPAFGGQAASVRQIKVEDTSDELSLESSEKSQNEELKKEKRIVRSKSFINIEKNHSQDERTSRIKQNVRNN
jgi:molybdopterin converting factor small subunit